VVQLKGWATCLIDTRDEIIVIELMFNNTFNEVDHHQIVALACCFFPCEKSFEQVHWTNGLVKPLRQLHDIAQWISHVQHECKLEFDIEKYVESTTHPHLMDVIYHWSNGASFLEVINKIGIFGMISTCFYLWRPHLILFRKIFVLVKWTGHRPTVCESTNVTCT
jgi:ATP-dependent RNA helicase DOB1